MSFKRKVAMVSIARTGSAGANEARTSRASQMKKLSESGEEGSDEELQQMRQMIEAMKLVSKVTYKFQYQNRAEQQVIQCKIILCSRLALCREAGNNVLRS